MKSITIRIPEGLKELIAEEAEGNGQTQSDYVRQILEAQVGQVNEEKFQRQSHQNFSLSVVERKTLSLGCQLLLAAHGDLPDELYDAESIHDMMKALEYGYAGEYPRIFSGADDGLTYEECKLAWDILDMFRGIKYSIRDLGRNGWKQTGVVEAEYYGSFRGFDYQVDLESKLARYVDYLVETCRWEEQKEFLQTQGGNSHTEMLPTYRAMLAEFKPAWRKATSRGSRSNLSAKEISRVLLAAPGARLE